MIKIAAFGFMCYFALGLWSPDPSVFSRAFAFTIVMAVALIILFASTKVEPKVRLCRTCGFPQDDPAAALECTNKQHLADARTRFRFEPLLR